MLNINEKHWPEEQMSPKISVSDWKEAHLSPSCFIGYISLWNLTGNPCFKPPSCQTWFDSLTWCCKHSFYLDSYLSFDLLSSLANRMHVTNCCFLLSKVSSLFDMFDMFLFCGFPLCFFVVVFLVFCFFFSWLACSVWNCLDTIHSHQIFIYMYIWLN